MVTTRPLSQPGGTAPIEGRKRPRVTSVWSNGRLLFVTPLVMFLVGTVFIPGLIGIWTSFRKYSVASAMHGFAGVDNFAAALTNTRLYDAITFTVVFTIASLVLEIAFGSLLALLFDQAFPGKKIVITTIMFPIMIAPAFMSTLWRLSLSSDVGIVGAIANELGISTNLLSYGTVIPTVIAVEVLHWAPFVMVLLYSGLQSVPEDLYEAAAVDGAGYWRTRARIVLPYLAPIIAVTIFLRLIDALKTFETIYVLTGGGPGTTTTNLNLAIYKLAFDSGNFGQAAAVSLMYLIVLLVLVPLVTRYLVPKR